MTKNKFMVKRTRANGRRFGERKEENSKIMQGNREDNYVNCMGNGDFRRDFRDETKRGEENDWRNPEYEDEYANQYKEDFENERNQYLTEKLEFQAQRALSEENLPASFAKILCGEDEEETLENIAVFKKEFLKAVEAALYERLRGSTPKTSSGTVEYDPFLKGFGY